MALTALSRSRSTAIYRNMVRTSRRVRRGEDERHALTKPREKFEDDNRGKRAFSVKRAGERLIYGGKNRCYCLSDFVDQSALSIIRLDCFRP